MNYGIKAVGPSKANGFVNLVPAVTAVVSLLFFGERFTLLKAAGMAVVILGVLLSSTAQLRSAGGNSPGSGMVPVSSKQGSCGKASWRAEAKTPEPGMSLPEKVPS